MKAEIVKLEKGGYVKIPSDYLLELEFKDQVLCIIENGEIVLRPFYEEQREESKDLLDQLRSEGFEGEELLIEYKKRKKSY